MIRFAKAHACGNDFLIVEDLQGAGPASAELARRLCDRHTGVGADGIEFLRRTGERSGRIRLQNADGSVAEISGNGTRCVAALMAHTGHLRAGDVVSLETDAGARECRIERAGGTAFLISSGMGLPRIEPKLLRLGDDAEVSGAVVWTGNPHFVIFTENESFAFAGRPWERLGQEICEHPHFPEQTNVEFVRLGGSGQIEIRIFERGVGPTSSSGTGTTAAAATAIALGGAEHTLQVIAPGGVQQICWPGPQDEIVLTGPAELIAEGTVLLPSGPVA